MNALWLWVKRNFQHYTKGRSRKSSLEIGTKNTPVNRRRRCGRGREKRQRIKTTLKRFNQCWLESLRPCERWVWWVWSIPPILAISDPKIEVYVNFGKWFFEKIIEKRFERGHSCWDPEYLMLVSVNRGNESLCSPCIQHVGMPTYMDKFHRIDRVLSWISCCPGTSLRHSR